MAEYTGMFSREGCKKKRKEWESKDFFVLFCFTYGNGNDHIIKTWVFTASIPRKLKKSKWPSSMPYVLKERLSLGNWNGLR